MTHENGVGHAKFVDANSISIFFELALLESHTSYHRCVKLRLLYSLNLTGDSSKRRIAYSNIGKHIQSSVRILTKFIRSFECRLCEIAALQQIQSQLHANNAEISLSISLFVIVQGAAPMIWSVFSELKGRKVRCFVRRFINNNSNRHARLFI